jgi:predicted ABC-type transport system involved in lysophospholipase L1 biosynthesis ATPase subunit
MLANFPLETAVEQRATLVVVTHDPKLIARLGTAYRIKAGQLAGPVS